MTPRTEKIRVSCDPKDPGFRADAHRFDVFCDGVLLENWVTADEETGWARCARDFSLRRGIAELTDHHGRIAIRRKPDDPGESA